MNKEDHKKIIKKHFKLHKKTIELFKEQIKNSKQFEDVNVEFKDKKDIYNADDTSYYLISNDLELDGEYDIKKLGKKAGHITINILDKDVSFKKAAKYVLEVKEFLDKEKVPFYSIDFSLCYGKEYDEEYSSKDIYIANFLYKDIQEKDLEKRIKLASEYSK